MFQGIYMHGVGGCYELSACVCVCVCVCVGGGGGGGGGGHSFSEGDR